MRSGSSLALLLLGGVLAAAAPATSPGDAARAWMEQPPAAFAARLEREPALLPQALGDLGRALTSEDAALARDAESYLLQCARERGRALARKGAWSSSDVQGLLALQLVDAERFATDGAFRGRVLDMLPRALDPAVPAALRDDLLFGLNQVRGVDFAASEEVERAWGAAARRSSERRAPYAPGLRFEDEAENPLTASVYSLPSFFFSAAEADAFLSAVRQAAPGRTLVVLTDLPLRRALEARAKALDVQLLETYGRSYSPWPRDPFSLVRAPAGGVRVLVRPNLQRGREEDAHLGAELIQNLPEEVDRAWGKATWSEAPVPFHNGQILLTRDAVWITLHTLEPHILALLETDRVPVESFNTAEGIDRYVEAARKAANELGTLYGRKARFVHPLPEPGSPLPGRMERMRRLGGGAGYDLDSIVTLLPGSQALVADLDAGRELLAKLPAEEREALRRGYDLGPSGADLAGRLDAAQRTPRAAALDGFLDLTAGHLAAQGMSVRRLPLLLLPMDLLRDSGGLQGEFLLTWNNVVVEARGRRARAEGFSSLLPTGDRLARETFTAAGAHLDLFPPLVRSVILNGGYRCASNHVRTRG